MTLYRTIVADPPWDYGEHGCCRGGQMSWDKVNAGYKMVADKGYQVMPTESIAALPVAGFAETDAHLYLWTVNKFICEAHTIAKAWGFRPMTLLTWGKVKADGAASMKTGYYFRGATEHCLFCVRGSLPLQVKEGRPTLYMSERLPHSVKPEWFYDLVEECSPGPRLELFARPYSKLFPKRPGWDV